MYERNGLMVKLRNEKVIGYIRGITDRSATEIIENALRKRLGIPEKNNYNRLLKRRKNPENINSFPVKISDQELIDYLVNLRSVHGVMNRYCVENAILEVMGEK